MSDDPTVSDLEPATASEAGLGGRRSVPVLWIAVGLLLIAGVAAAVLTRDDRSPAERVGAAPDAVAEAGSYGFEITIAADLGAASNELRLTGDVDAEAERSSASFDVGTGRFQMVSEGSTVYVRVPEAARAAAGGRSWAKIDLGRLVPGFGGVGAGADPTTSFDALRTVGSEVEDLGEEEVRGTSTRHFRTVLDLTDQVDRLGDGQAEALGPLRDQLAAVPVDVWLDGDDRIRRQRTSLDLGAAGFAGGGKIVTTVEAFDYGKAVSIEVPPVDDVFEGDAGSLGSLFSG
ncbi:MAG TPA: hypothetical protein VM933_09990 [Acidimicrobiales bacterium]|nr:hypothetical protein [Acidimicrobiales bacterium]